MGYTDRGPSLGNAYFTKGNASPHMPHTAEDKLYPIRVIEEYGIGAARMVWE